MHVSLDANTSQSVSNKNGILYIAFNQDYGCFSCGTERGFYIYNSLPLRERFRREFKEGGFGIVAMLFRSNVLALVGGGKNPKYPPNKVIIWDDYQNKCIAELAFASNVKNICLRRDRIVVVLETEVYVYAFNDLLPLDKIITGDNPKGLVALSPNSSNTVLVCPGKAIGSVQIQLYDSQQKKIISAHTNALSQMVLNLDGNLLATSSDKGTLIRIWDTATGNRLRELRRGVDRAEIYSLAFHPKNQWLVVSSDKGTIHLYSLTLTEGGAPLNGSAPLSSSNQPDVPENRGENRHSSLSFMKDILPSYFSSEWSFAQFKIPESPCICAFGSEKNSVIVACLNGTYFKYIFDPVKGGEAKQEGYSVFIKDPSDEQ